MSSVSKCKKAGAVTGELVSLSSSPESIVLNFIFLFVGYTTKPGCGLAYDREVEAALAAVLTLCPSGVSFSCLFSFGPRLLNTSSCAQLVRVVYYSFVICFGGPLSTLVFNDPRISSLPGKPGYLIMWTQEVFSVFTLLPFLGVTEFCKSLSGKECFLTSTRNPSFVRCHFYLVFGLLYTTRYLQS